MTARPMTEGEMAKALEEAKDVLRLYHEYEAPKPAGGRAQAFDRYADAATLYGDVLARALLSTSAAVRGMREALKEIAGHNGVLGATYREQAHLMREIAIAALSGIEPGEDEQARPSGSAPISTDTKGTTK